MTAALLLLSGGIESVTLLYANRRGEWVREPLRALFLDYGQRAVRREREAAEHYCGILGLTLTMLDLGQVGRAFRRGQERMPHVPLPHRNLVALSLGLSYAERIGAGRVMIGLNRDDGDACPSAGAEFLGCFRAMAAALGKIEVEVPFLNLTKTEVVQQGYRLGVDYSRSYSCLLGHPQHCGRCPQCRKRRTALAAFG